jgi:hypothetical protein
MSEGCGNHKALEDSIVRQEAILEKFRSDNAEHRLHMVGQIGELSVKLDQLVEVKDTLRLHNQRWDDDNKTCELHRSGLWTAINLTNSRLDKRDGITAIVAAVFSGVGVVVGYIVTLLIRAKQ